MNGKVLQTGTNGKVAVIGRSMGAVEVYAADLRATGSNVELFDKSVISESAQKEWTSLKEFYPNGRIPDEVVPNTLMFKENEAWIGKLKSDGYSVVDSGNPLQMGRSVFYEMEKEAFR